MSAIGDIVARLIAAGTPPDIAAIAVTEAFAAGAETRNVGGQSADITAEKRRAYDRNRLRLKRENPPTSTGHPPTSADITNPSLSLVVVSKDSPSKKETKQESKKRGERLSADWAPGAVGIEFAISHGMGQSRISVEAEKFRNYWLAKSGDTAAKLDWAATWRNWVLSSLERSPAAPRNGPTGTGEWGVDRW